MVILSNFLAPEEGIRHEEQHTTLYIDDREVGTGTMYITESVLSWINSDTRQGFSLEYPHISLHAISRDQQVYPRQCLYIMVDAKVDFPESSTLSNESNTTNDDDDDDSDSAAMTEMRFAPDNINNLDAMFQAMSQCQALHPDPQDSFSDAEEDIYEDAEEDEFEYSEVGAGDAPYIIPDEVFAEMHATNCRKCTNKQKETVQLVKAWFERSDPAEWKKFLNVMEDRHRRRRPRK